MKQPSRFCFCTKIKRRGEFFRQISHFAKMVGQQLPTLQVRIGFPVRQRRRVRVIIHIARQEIFLEPCEQ